MNKNIIPTITSIISLTILEGIALYKGVDGQLLSLVVAVIAGLGGFHISKLIKPKE
jgi:hypothetical protein